jgi:glycerol-3-phosphate dehydrogenase (NAD(P)+)
MTKIGLAFGAQPHTFMGLAGIGDLVLTATDELSRNYSVGYRLGSGESVGDIIGSMTMVAEGYKTSIAVKELTDEFNIDAPICSTVYEILHADLSPHDGAYRLCHRPLADELSGITR